MNDHIPDANPLKTTSGPADAERDISKKDTEAKLPRTLPTVSSVSPAYPKYRNALIIGCVILVIMAVLWGGYLLTRGAGRSFEKLKQNPVEFITRLFKRLKTYEVCEAFLIQNQGRFPQLGENLQFYPTKQEFRVFNRDKTARTTIRVVGSAGPKNVHFLLKRRNGTWHINSVLLEHMNGTIEVLYSEEKGDTSGNLRNTDSHLKKISL